MIRNMPRYLLALLLLLPAMQLVEAVVVEMVVSLAPLAAPAVAEHTTTQVVQ